MRAETVPGSWGNVGGRFVRSLSETDAPQQILKARFVGQLVPLRFDAQKYDFRVSLFVTSLQPGDGFVTLVETVVGQRDVIRRNLTLS